MTDDTDPVVERLRVAQPVPRAVFRGLLRRHLRAIGSPPPRPQRLALLVTGFTVSGAVLIAVGLVSVLGAGPLSA